MEEYFKEASTYHYLLNALGFLQMRFELPGVFSNNVFVSVNGSLWTLTLEVWCRRIGNVWPVQKQDEISFLYFSCVTGIGWDNFLHFFKWQ